MEPHLIPEVMEVDRGTKWAICDGKNNGHCREADAFLKHDMDIPPAHEAAKPRKEEEPPKEDPVMQKPEKPAEEKKEKPAE